VINQTMIDEYLSEIARQKKFLDGIIAEGKSNFLTDTKTCHSAKYSLIVVVEAMSNTLQHLLGHEHQVATESYSDTFIKASEYGIIPEELSVRLVGLAEPRNSFLVHGYWRCIDSDLFDAISTGTEDLTAFTGHIDEYLKTGNTWRQG
jgi:uncharacterized protein YutE (UPF0331/DUF86 family)